MPSDSKGVIGPEYRNILLPHGSLGLLEERMRYGDTFEGATMASPDVLQRVEQQRKKAEAILRDLDLTNLWRRFGRPRLFAGLTEE
jgi:hypothetical protein